MGPAEELQKDINIMIKFVNEMGRLVGDQNCSYLFNIKSLNQQKNGVDCGIYLIKNFINTIDGKENSLFSPKDIKQLRLHIATELLENGKIVKN